MRSWRITTLRRQADRGLTNRFTLVRRTSDDAEDAWGQVDRDEETAEHRLGRYLPKGTAQIGPLGVLTVSEPTLFVPHDEPLAVGDIVRDIRSLDNAVVLLAGPLTVMDVQPDAAEPLRWRCTLGAQTPAPLAA